MGTLNKLLLRVWKVGLFKGIKVGEGDTYEEVTHLSFTDNTLVFVNQKKVHYSTLCVILHFQAV